MHNTEIFNPPRESCLELLTWAYTNTINIGLNSEQIALKAKEEEKNIYINAKDEKNYNEKIIHSITSTFTLGINRLSKKEQDKIVRKKYINFIKTIYDNNLKVGILDINSHEEKLSFLTEISEFYENVASLSINEAIEILSNFTKSMTTLAINSINDINIRRPRSLKEISSEKVINDSLVFAKFTELVEKNEVPFSIAEKLLEDSRNVPISFKELIESKRKKSLEKESITNEM